MPLPVEVLKGLPGSVFIETGTHRGDGIQAALDTGQFDAIYSMDILPFAYGWASHRFQDKRQQVHLFLSDSRMWLNQNFKIFLPARAVFWLDAHWCGGNGEMKGREVNTESEPSPLLEELRIIGSARKDHTILIDDMRMMKGDRHWPTRDELEEKLRLINPGYHIRYVDSDQFTDDILVAVAP